MDHGERNLKEDLQSDHNPAWHRDAAEGGGAGLGCPIHLHV